MNIAESTASLCGSTPETPLSRSRPLPPPPRIPRHSRRHGLLGPPSASSSASRRHLSARISAPRSHLPAGASETRLGLVAAGRSPVSGLGFAGTRPAPPGPSLGHVNCATVSSQHIPPPVKITA